MFFRRLYVTSLSPACLLALSVSAEETDLWVEGYEVYMAAIFRRNRTPSKFSSHAHVFLKHLRHSEDCLTSFSEGLCLKWSNHYNFLCPDLLLLFLLSFTGFNIIFFHLPNRPKVSLPKVSFYLPLCKQIHLGLSADVGSPFS